MSSIRQQARVAGVLYLLLALTAPLGLLYVPGKVIVLGNASATAANIRASEGLLRGGIASELIHQLIAVFLVLALYRLFKTVDEALARQVVVLGALVSVPIVFVNVLNEVAALTLVSGADFLSVFEQPQLDALAYLFLRLHGQGITVASVFWGLWLFPFGHAGHPLGLHPARLRRSADHRGGRLPGELPSPPWSCHGTNPSCRRSRGRSKSRKCRSSSGC